MGSHWIFGDLSLDLRHSGRYRGRRKFNCRLVISQGRSVAHSLRLNRAFPGPPCRRRRRLRKIAPGHHLHSTVNFDGEAATSSQRH